MPEPFILKLTPNSNRSPSAEPPKLSDRNRLQMLSRFINHGQRQLTPSGLRVWLVLFRDTDDDGLARVTVRRIVFMAGITTVAVTNGLRELRDKRFAVRVARGTGSKRSSIYRLLPITTYT